MSKSTTVIIIYVLGLVIGALFFDLWGAETSIKKGLIGIGWTALFLIFPGFITDFMGLILVLPFTRKLIIFYNN